MPTAASKAISALATTALALAFVPLTPAAADTVIPLRDSVKSLKVGSGSITISVRSQKARLSPGMVALPTTRNAWVSGVIDVKLSGADVTGGSIEAGYVVGCQVNVGSAAISVSGGADGPVLASSSDDASIAGATGSTGAALSLAAGTIGNQSLTFDRKTWPKPGDEIKPDWNQPATSYDFTGPSGSLSYADQTIGVDGCAGYAQARLYVYVAAQIGNDEATSVLWGPTFSLG